jgi:DNA-binding NtrC family response regulator
MGAKKRATVLVVDDEHGIRQSLNMVLKDDFQVLLAATGAEAIDTFTKNAVHLVLLDILLPDIEGLALLKGLKEIDSEAEIIMVTAVKDVQTAVQSIKLGAYEYIVKPFIVEEVINVINRALEKHSLVKEVAYLRNELERYHPFEKILGDDQKMRDIFSLIETISKSDGAVLIQGESGTGKELVARATHNLSPRRNHPFVVVNCAAIPPTLMESEIFGYRRGAFTGATMTTLGKLEIADKGDVFLDDIDLLDINMQAKLLRVIQEKEFERLGSNKVIKVDVRFLAASNKDLQDLIPLGKFREDLFYRLNVFPITLPPLRERRGDIPLLLDHFLDIHTKRIGGAPKRFSKKAVEILMQYDWPGNVRELQNLVERLVTIKRQVMIQPKDVAPFSAAEKLVKGDTLRAAVVKFERKYIRDVLAMTHGNRKATAEILGIHRNTLLSKMNELGLKN